MEAIKDHNLDGKDDVSEISSEKKLAYNRLDRFQYRFPFYRMDVNGY